MLNNAEIISNSYKFFHVHTHLVLCTKYAREKETGNQRNTQNINEAIGTRLTGSGGVYVCMLKDEKKYKRKKK